ncbi:Two pore segment channel 2 [Fasciola gigantica]|uniref:Two pore segment channel 2 n=1 Tax=Fasciola gigantica TaxID=46835 RepID=A0A504YX91_FASGI|nr:Two pore segment channel 2 [Fasciola gigantica]
MGCDEFYRVRRFLRPYFLISGSQMMKKLLKSLKRTLPKLFSWHYIGGGTITQCKKLHTGGPQTFGGRGNRCTQSR